MIQIVIQIECLHGTEFLNPDCGLDFTQCKWGISQASSPNISLDCLVPSELHTVH